MQYLLAVICRKESSHDSYRYVKRNAPLTRSTYVVKGLDKIRFTAGFSTSKIHAMCRLQQA